MNYPQISMVCGNHLFFMFRMKGKWGDLKHGIPEKVSFEESHNGFNIWGLIWFWGKALVLELHMLDVGYENRSGISSCWESALGAEARPMVWTAIFFKSVEQACQIKWPMIEFLVRNMRFLYFSLLS